VLGEHRLDVVLTGRRLLGRHGLALGHDRADDPVDPFRRLPRSGLTGLMLPLSSVRTSTQSAIQRSIGLPPVRTIGLSGVEPSTRRSSDFVGGDRLA
jgi:hypothetical protein